MNDENRQNGDRDRGPRKPGSGRPSGGRPSSGRPGAGKPSGDRKPYSRDGKPGDRPARPARDGERKPYSRDGAPSGERKPWSRDGAPSRDGDRRPPRDGERKPYSRDGKPAGERKPWSRDGKPGDRPARPARDGDRKPWSRDGAPSRDGDRRPPRDGERKPYGRDGKPAGERKPWSRDGAPSGERKPWSRDGAPSRDGDRRPPRDGERKPWSRDGAPSRDGERKPWEKRDGDRPSSPRGSRPARDGDRKPYSRDGQPGRPDRGGSDRPRRDYDLNPLTPFELKRREERAAEPELEAQFSGTNLDRAVVRDISTLNEDNKIVVGKHLESAAFFADEDPERALQHALAAKRRASRLAVVRETVGIMAYVTEDFALALAELRTAARISGSNDQIALIIDCLRALNRAEEGLKIARDLDRAALPREARIDLAIVLSGIRLDRGETDRAFAELQIAELDPTNATIESVGLFDANAEVLEELGRAEEAAKWRKYARMTEDHYAPDEEMTIKTEYLEPDPSTFDVTQEGDADVDDIDAPEMSEDEPVESDDASGAVTEADDVADDEEEAETEGEEPEGEKS